MTSAEVSVVIPCFNQGRFLEEAVNSALEQTYTSLEVIVVDDGSTDRETITIVEKFESPRTRVFRKENSGPSGARNFGINQSAGRFILPLDADDKIAPSYVEKAVAVLESNPDVGIVYSEAAFFGGKEGKWELPRCQMPGILLDNCIFASAVFRKSDWQTAGGYNENMTLGWEDHDFWLSLIELNKQVIRIPETLFYYRQEAHSRTAQLDEERRRLMSKQLMLNHRQLYLKHFDYLFDNLIELKELLKADSDDATLRRELKLARDQIKQMEESGFWKLRNSWQSLRKALRRHEKTSAR